MRVNIRRPPKNPERNQRITVEIEPHDVWSLDWTLAQIIHPGLIMLKQQKNGAPRVDPEDVPEELRPTPEELANYEEDLSIDELWFERYDYILDEMIWAFEQKCRDHWEDDYYGPYIEGDDGKFLNGRFEWTDDKGRQAHQERMTNGFKLFGKYFEALWD